MTFEMAIPNAMPTKNREREAMIVVEVIPISKVSDTDATEADAAAGVSSQPQPHESVELSNQTQGHFYLQFVHTVNPVGTAPCPSEFEPQHTTDPLSLAAHA